MHQNVGGHAPQMTRKYAVDAGAPRAECSAVNVLARVGPCSRTTTISTLAI
jgi:hypothetical protein